MDKLISKISKYNHEKLQQYFEEEDIDILINLKNYFDDLYYNTGETSFSDENYDMLKEIIIKRKPDYVIPIGAKIREGENRVELPFHMGSMNKVKSEDEINKWLSKNKTSKYIIEEKLDGISCLAIFENGSISLFTRGDGRIGADISHLVNYFRNIPRTLSEDVSLVVRGELIIKKSVFEKKYSNEYANPRNFVSGRVGGKKVREGLSDIEFIAYEIINENPKYKNESPTRQLHSLKTYGFKTVRYEELDNINFEILTEKLLEFKGSSEYDIDGLIVQSDVGYFRNTSGNPSYAFAFKINLDENMKETEVIEVDWNISKHGVIKPRLRVREVNLFGSKVNFVTAHNAKYIVDNGIGAGAIIKITKSGETIPYIVDVIKKVEPAMPDIEYKWNETGVDILVVGDEYNETMCVKLIASFFDKLGIKHVSEATVSKMYNHGLDTLLKIIAAKQSDFEKIEGFGLRLAERTYENIHNGLQNLELYSVLGASSIFGQGIGEKKLKLLFDEYPLILSDYKKISDETLYDMINGIEGFSDITTRKIVENIEWAYRFIEALKLFGTFKTSEKLSGSLDDKKFVFSGFRDKNLEKQIEERGGQVTTSVSGKTYAVIVANKDESSGKIDKARALGLGIYDKDEFVKKYIN
jgi:NAD-dependent DNA ligase